jgi:hypothetical protein
MGGDLVSNDQAGGMGGADKPAGAQADNTFQNNKVKQLVVMVRYKPAPPSGFDTGAATSMLSGVTGAIEGAVSAVEGAMASIPGLDLFIKEEKKDSPSEKEYTYFKDYSGWDSMFKKIGEGLKEMNKENLTETFEFDSTDSEGRKKDAQKLLDKIKSKISAWSQYTAYIHFVGIGQGGNVANECTALLAKDSQFNSEKWLVKSLIYIATPLYTNQHLADEKSFKGKGAAFPFTNPYDLTQNAIACFDNNEKLLKLIEDSNKNTMSLMVGKIKMHVVQVLSILLSGLHLSGGDTSELKKFGKIKDEIEGMITDTVDLIKKVIDEGTSFVKLPDIPEFGKIADGYGDIPGQAVAKLQQFIEKFTDSAADQAKSANISLGPKDLAGALTCLCPVFDKIADSLSIFKYESKSGQELAMQIIDQAGVTKVFAPSDEAGEMLPVDDAYINKAAQAAAEGKPEQAASFVSSVRSMLSKAAKKNTDISAMSNEEKILVAQALSAMVQPMLPSKKKLFKKLLNLIPFDINKMTEAYSLDKLMAIPGGSLAGLGIDFPDELKQSIARADAEITRVKSYLDKSNFEMPEDSLYFIYNSHNLVLKKMYGPVANCIDKQTGYVDYMKSKGFDNAVTLTDNSYSQGTQEPKSNVLPAKELPAAKS